MVVISGEGHLIPILQSVFILIQGGLLLSGFGLVSFSLMKWLSRYSLVEAPDPTAFMRLFERFFDRLFAPIGWKVAQRTRTPVLRQLSFQLSVGGAVLLAALVVYGISATAITGTAYATYMLSGMVFDPVPVFRQVVAFVLICAFGVLFHAADRAKQLPVPR